MFNRDSLYLETDAVLGKTDGACTNSTNGRHPFRVQGTEYMVGAWTVSSDMIAIRDDGTTPIDQWRILLTSLEWSVI